MLKITIALPISRNLFFDSNLRHIMINSFQLMLSKITEFWNFAWVFNKDLCFDICHCRFGFNLIGVSLKRYFIIINIFTKNPWVPFLRVKRRKLLTLSLWKNPNISFYLFLLVFFPKFLIRFACLPYDFQPCNRRNQNIIFVTTNNFNIFF